VSESGSDYATTLFTSPVRLDKVLVGGINDKAKQKKRENDIDKKEFFSV
jgi:hypothetical protein